MNLSFDRLRTLVHVQRAGTLAAAARTLGVTPSAVSQQLSALEREVGGDVLVRRGRSIELSPLGELLAHGGDRVLAEIERTSAAAERMLDSVNGSYVVAALPSVALAIMSETVRRLGDDAPELDVTVIDGEADAAVELLTAQAIDLALVDTYADEPATIPEGLRATTLGTEPFVVLAPAGAGVGPDPVGLRQLAGLPWVMAPDAAGCGGAARRACRQAGFDPVVRWESNDLMVLRESVSAGLGIALLPRLAVGDPPPGTVVVAVRNRGLRREIVAITRTATAERPPERAVLTALATAAAPHLRRSGTRNR